MEVCIQIAVLKFGLKMSGHLAKVNTIHLHFIGTFIGIRYGESCFSIYYTMHVLRPKAKSHVLRMYCITISTWIMDLVWVLCM